MTAVTPKTPRRRPGGVQRRQELGPAALQKTGLRVGLLRGCREVSRLLGSLETPGAPAREL